MSRDRDQFIIIQRSVTVQDAAGEEIPTWFELAEEDAKVTYGRGSERRQAAMEQGIQAATFQVDGNPETYGVQLTDRIILNGYIWNIAGVSPDKPKRGLVEIDATATGEMVEEAGS